MPGFQPFMFGDKQGGGMRPAPPSAARSAAAWVMWVKFGGWRVGRPERRDDSDDTGETGRTEWTTPGSQPTALRLVCMACTRLPHPYPLRLSRDDGQRESEAIHPSSEVPGERERAGQTEKNKTSIKCGSAWSKRASQPTLKMSACTRPWARWQIGQHDVAFLAATKGCCTRSTIRLVRS